MADNIRLTDAEHDMYMRFATVAKKVLDSAKEVFAVLSEKFQQAKDGLDKLLSGIIATARAEGMNSALNEFQSDVDASSQDAGMQKDGLLAVDGVQTELLLPENVSIDGNTPGNDSIPLAPNGGSGIISEGTQSQVGDGAGDAGGADALSAGNKVLFRGDSFLYSDKGLNGLKKAHIDSIGDLVPANIEGLYKGKEVSVTEHVLGGFRKGAKSNSPYISFTGDEGIIANYGSKIIKVDLNRLVADINSGKLRGVEVLNPEQVQAAIQSDSSACVYWKGLALKWAKRDNEYLIKGVIPQGYIKIIEGGD